MPLDDVTPKPSRTWRVEMLGGLRAVPEGDGGECVEVFRTHKTALLLAYLALYSHRAHARDELADLLWPDMPPDRGRANLSQTLLYLRGAFGETKSDRLFVADHKTVRVQKNALQTDVADWEAAAQTALASTLKEDDAETAARVRAALTAYTGDLLPGFYDGWVSDERARLTELRDRLKACLQSLPAAEIVAAVAQHVPHPKIGTVSEKTVPPKVENAPLLLTRFFGRDAERSDACARLGQNPPTRLLTLVGMGGIGKTRLSLEIAHAVIGRDGNCPPLFGWAAFVPLAEAQTPDHMESALQHALGLQNSGTDIVSAVIAHLNTRCGAGRALLVLDNLEQLGEASAPLVTRLLAGVPALTILATSRQPVGIAGEQELSIGPLGESPNHENDEGDVLVRLFVDRARLVRADFAITAQNEQAVSDLCRLLEGVPLALELAAAWARVLTPAQTAARLNNRFDLLALRGSSSLDAPKRHRSLHAAIAWSYDLLGPSLQNFFAQLSVFRGGWTAEAAQAVTGITDVSEPLLLLAERSLILTDNRSDSDEETAPRWRMLESLREFAGEQLSDEERTRLMLRHAQFFDTLSEKAEQLVEAVKMHPALVLLNPERDNMRAAMDWALAESSEAVPQGTEHGVRIITQTTWFWLAGEAAPFLQKAEALLPVLPDAARRPLHVKLLLQYGNHSLYAGDFEQAGKLLTEAMALCKVENDEKNLMRVKSRLGELARRTNDPAGALAFWTECLEHARHLGEVRSEAAYLNNVAIVHTDADEQRRFIEQAVALDRLHVPGSYFLACSLNTMGAIATEQGDYHAARTCLEEAYDLARADSSAGMMGVIQTCLVELALKTGQHLDRAHELLDEAHTLFENKGETMRVAEVLHLRFRLALTCEEPGEAAEQAGRYLRLQRQTGRDATWLQTAHKELVNQLQKAGFDAQAEQMAKTPPV